MQQQDCEILKAQSGDRGALTHVVCSNLKLIIKPAKKAVTLHYPISEALAAGIIGLGKACLTFKVNRNIQFVTHAVPAIIDEIQNEQFQTRSPLSIPNYLHKRFNLVYYAGKHLERMGKEASNSAKAEFIGQNSSSWQPTTQQVSLVEALYGCQIEQECNIEWVTENAITQDESLYESEMHRKLQQLFGTLTATEKRVLLCRFGWGRQKEATLKEIGTELGVSEERVHAIIKNCLRKLRAGFCRLDINDYKREEE